MGLYNLNREYKFIDLFAGLGGFRLAFEKQGCTCVFSSEIDKQVASIYAKNFGELPEGDIRTISSQDIPDHDILCAGFPCQSFSIAGYRKGFEDSRGNLFFEVARILKEKHPKAFILENVKGITNHDKGNTIKVINNVLSELGYDFKSQVLNAKDFGIPQNRERWYCIGVRKDLGIDINNYYFPKEKITSVQLQSIINANLPDEKYNISDICKEHIKKFIKLKNIIVQSDTLAYEIRPSRCQFKNDSIAPCLTAKMGTGGNNIPVVVKQMRKLTEKECLQIMGYPSSYIIGKGANAYKQIGNSVVVPIINELAKNLIELLNINTSENTIVNDDNFINNLEQPKEVLERECISL